MPAAHDARAKLFDFVVRSNEQVADGVFRMTFESGVALELAAGEFMDFAVPGNPAQVLRVPISFSHAEAASKTVQIEYAVVGDGTRRLSKMAPGDASTLVGPCGHGWCLPAKSGRALLVSGGIGIPPIVAASEMLSDAGIAFDAILGAQTADKVVACDVDAVRAAGSGDADCRVVVATDDGSLGYHGFTTGAMEELLSERSYGSAYTCGPTPMMAGVSRLAAGAGIACQASLERMMGCGFGACSCCNVAMADGSTRLCCMDGPVFDAEEVAW